MAEPGNCRGSDCQSGEKLTSTLKREHHRSRPDEYRFAVARQQVQDDFLAVHDGETKRPPVRAELRHTALGRFWTCYQDIDMMHSRIVFGDGRSVK